MQSIIIIRTYLSGHRHILFNKSEDIISNEENKHFSLPEPMTKQLLKLPALNRLLTFSFLISGKYIIL
jgi:hypothetical protein